jgi:RHS repeat-associated protein
VDSNDGTTTYTYDNVGQLLGADHHSSANPVESYTYDLNGNRLTAAAQSGSDQITKDNRLASDGTFTYTYDNEGNLTQRTEIATKNVRIFEWDDRNRLTAVIDKDATGNVTQQVLFTYDALNGRIAQEVKQGASDAATYFITDRGNPLLDFVDDDGPAGPHPPALATRYLTGPAVDQVFAEEDASGRVSWLLTDRLGSIRDLVDQTGAVVNHIAYDSFGNVIGQSHPDVVTRFLFAGGQFDAKTGLYYERTRYYDSKLGRFLSEDPVGFLGGTNLYRYVHNSPASRIDPLGTQDDNPDGMAPVSPGEEPTQPNVSYPEEPVTEPVSYPEPVTEPVSYPAEAPTGPMSLPEPAGPSEEPTVVQPQPLTEEDDPEQTSEPTPVQENPFEEDTVVTPTDEETTIDEATGEPVPLIDVSDTQTSGVTSSAESDDVKAMRAAEAAAEERRQRDLDELRANRVACAAGGAEYCPRGSGLLPVVPLGEIHGPFPSPKGVFEGIGSFFGSGGGPVLQPAPATF